MTTLEIIQIIEAKSEYYNLSILGLKRNEGIIFYKFEAFYKDYKNEEHMEIITVWFENNELNYEF